MEGSGEQTTSRLKCPFVSELMRADRMLRAGWTGKIALALGRPKQSTPIIGLFSFGFQIGKREEWKSGRVNERRRAEAKARRPSERIGESL